MINQDGEGLASPAAREAIDALATDVEMLELDAVSTDPLTWPGYREELQRAQDATGEAESAVAVSARIDGVPSIVVALDFRFMGGSMGEATGKRIVGAFDEARRRRVPVVSLVASGGARMQEGMRSLLQMQKIAAACAAMREEGIPHVGILRHPTTGGIWASLAASADILFALPGTTVAFAGPRVRGRAGATDSQLFVAEGKLRTGFVDHVLDEHATREAVALAVRLLSPSKRGETAPAKVPRPLGSRAPKATGWESVVAARAPSRPRAHAYLDDYFESRVSISGDRVGGLGRGMVCGFGRREGRTIAYAAQDGTATSPSGFRSAARLVQLAERFDVPVLTLIDTPGAANDDAAERSGVGTAIAELFQAVARCRVPITSLVIGEGGSGGALALASHRDLWIVPAGYFGVIAPEGATAILKQDAAGTPQIAEQMGLAPADLARLEIVAGIAAGEDS